MQHEPKHFTVEEANGTLPLVRRIVRDIVDAYPGFTERQRALEELGSGDGSGLREEVAAAADRINGFIAELEQIGCVFKGVEGGLVDFPSQHDGRTIFLCWKLGEDSIRFWHEVDAGYAGRKPITPKMFGG